MNGLEERGSELKPGTAGPLVPVLLGGGRGFIVRDVAYSCLNDL